MTTMTRVNNRLIVALVAVACLYSRTIAAAEAGAEPKVMKLTPVDRYVFDFSGSEDGGVPGGNFENFAFALDLRDSVRKIAVRRGEQRKDVIASYDFADCTKGQESLLQRPLTELAAGKATWVDYIDIEMIPISQKDLRWTGGVCFGY